MMGLASFNRARRLAAEKAVREAEEQREKKEAATLPDYQAWLYADLRKEAASRKVDRYYDMNKQQLIEALRG